ERRWGGGGGGPGRAGWVRAEGAGGRGAVCPRCRARARARRYASAADLAADLEHWLNGEPLSVRPPGLAALLRAWARQNFGAGAWAVVVGLVLGLFGGALGWVVMINPWELSNGALRWLFFLWLGVWSSTGLITVALVRPRNASADLAAGVVAGLLAAVACYTVSWGWAAVQLAGLPLGIWLGMLSALWLVGLPSAAWTLAAGALLRRRGRLRAVVAPYVEFAVPATLAFVCVTAIPLRLAFGLPVGQRAWLLLALPFLVPAAAGVLRSWPWAVRVPLHAVWVGLFVVAWMR